MEASFKPGQSVRVNLAGMQVEGVMFQAAVTDAVGNVIKQTSEDPPKYLVRLRSDCVPTQRAFVSRGTYRVNPPIQLPHER
jgi:hypothetical protein